MRTFLVSLVSLAITSALLGAADGKTKKAKKTTERAVVIPEDKTPFTVSQADIVRLTGKGIAGARITAKIDGPAKLLSTSGIFRRQNGHPLIGLGNKEFEIKPTGKGNVTVTITSKPPQPDAKSSVEKYEFTVE